MPVPVQAVITAMVPDLNDLGQEYPRHVGMAQGVMSPVWTLATKPETFLKAEAFAELGFPPVTAVAAEVHRVHQAGQINAAWDLTKQFAGVAIAVLMKANGYSNAGRKRSVPHAAWNVGTCFTQPNPPATPATNPATPTATPVGT
jgi:hypothetical protein